VKKLFILVVSLVFTHAAFAKEVTGQKAKHIIINGETLTVGHDETPNYGGRVAFAHIVFANELFFCSWSFHHLKRWYSCDDNSELNEAAEN